MAIRDPKRQLTSRTRLETFSDGVIAISITLTVLSIQVPHGLPNSRVGSAILHLIPDVSTYLLSFAVIGAFWMSHHFVLDRIERVDRRIMLLNLGFLAAISLVPLVTSLLSQYSVSVSVMTYASVMTVAALSELAIWLYAEHHGLLAETVTDQDRAESRSRLLTATGIFAASIPVALLSIVAAQLMWLLILFRVPLARLGRLRRRRETASG
jgi:TMEM175 potassium channel family protein